VAALRGLGLTANEAEVYLALLQTAAAGPASGYKVAQTLGKDPANLSKILLALVRQGAVRVVQQKPKLFLAVPAAEFTAELVSNLEARRQRAVTMLRGLKPQEPEHHPRALGRPAQALDHAGRLLSGCRTEALLWAEAPVQEQLGEPLARLIESESVRVRIAEPEDKDLGAGDLLLVCDRQTCLIANLAEAGSATGPCGWSWQDPRLARLWANVLLADPVPVRRQRKSAPAAAGKEAAGAAVTERFTHGVFSGSPARPADLPPQSRPETEKPAKDDLEFIIRHDERDDPGPRSGI
jgi:hypothetical protein